MILVSQVFPVSSEFTYERASELKKRRKKRWLQRVISASLLPYRFLRIIQLLPADSDQRCRHSNLAGSRRCCIQEHGEGGEDCCPFTKCPQTAVLCIPSYFHRLSIVVPFFPFNLFLLICPGPGNQVIIS